MKKYAITIASHIMLDIPPRSTFFKMCIRDRVYPVHAFGLLDSPRRLYERSVEESLENSLRQKLGSTVKAGSELSANDAAMRLYYLGLISGDGTDINGGVQFSLERRCV